MKLFIPLILLVIYSFYAGVYLNNPNFYDENRTLENLQSLAIFVSMLTFIYNTKVVKNELKIYLWLGALLTFSFLLREIDFEDFNIYIVTLLFSGIGKRVLLVILWIFALYYLFKDWNKNLDTLISILQSKIFIIALISLAFLIASDLSEKELLGIHPHQFYEELFELIGYYLLFIISLKLK